MINNSFRFYLILYECSKTNNLKNIPACPCLTSYSNLVTTCVETCNIKKEALFVSTLNTRENVFDSGRKRKFKQRKIPRILSTPSQTRLFYHIGIYLD